MELLVVGVAIGVMLGAALVGLVGRHRRMRAHARGRYITHWWEG